MAEHATRDAQRLPALLAAVGVLCSLVLEGLHLQAYFRPAASSFCSVGQQLDCLAVAASPESVFLGLPWAIWGLLGFGTLLAAAVRRSRWLLPLSLVAAATSVALLVVSLVVVKSVCLVCEAAHLTAVVLAAVVVTRRKTLVEPYGSGDAQAQLLALPAGLALALVLFLPEYWQAFSYRGEPPLPTGITKEGDPWIGSPDPKVVLHEFTDYYCPHCKAATVRSLRLLASEPGLRIVRRQNPRTHCKKDTGHACLAARAAACAGEQGRFWQADRWLFAFADPKRDLDLDALARDVHLDQAKLDSCVERPDVYQKIEDGFRFTRRKGLREVPSYFDFETKKKLSPSDLDAYLDDRI